MTPSESAPSTLALIGLLTGMDELAALLAASEPTNAALIRKVVVSLPENMPEAYRRQEAANTAIREFFLIADRESDALRSDGQTPQPAPDLTASGGVRADLPNGGTITLKLRKENNGSKQDTIGELRIGQPNIPGYERVNQIKFAVE